MFLRKFWQKFDALEWGYFLGAALPGVLLIGVLSVRRQVDQRLASGLLGHLDMMKSGFFLSLGLLGAGLVLLYWMRGRAGRNIALICLQVGWICVAIIEVASHLFYLSTGSTLDFYLLRFTLTHLTDNVRVISSEVSLDGYFILAFFAALIALAPWMIRQRILRKIARGPRELEAVTKSRTSKNTVLCGLASVALILAAGLPPLAGTDGLLARSPVVNVALTAVDSLNEALQGTPANKLPTTLQARITPRLDASKRNADKPRNLVFLILESTGAHSTTVYNPSLKTTPFLADLASRSTLAQNAYVVMPHSTKALVTIFCGIEPNFHMPVSEAFADAIPGRCLPELLAEQGYHSVFFQTATQHFENRKQLIKNFGFRESHFGDEMDPTGFEHINYFGYEDEILLEPSRKWLAAHKDKPFLAAYFTLTTHHPYLPPKRYALQDFAGDDLLNRYLNTVYYLDRFVEQIIAQYKEAGVYENTIFIILGDHGEAFGEHGRFQHDSVIYQEGVRVPLLIFDPQHPEPQIIPYNINHLDLLPSALNRLDFEIKDAQFPGSAITQVDHERPMRMHCWYERRCMAEIVGDEKYIHHFDTQPDEFFNLREDPAERNDIAASRDDLNARRQKLLDWRRDGIGLHEGYRKSLKEGR